MSRRPSSPFGLKVRAGVSSGGGEDEVQAGTTWTAPPGPQRTSRAESLSSSAQAKT